MKTCMQRTFISRGAWRLDDVGECLGNIDLEEVRHLEAKLMGNDGALLSWSLNITSSGRIAI